MKGYLSNSFGPVARARVASGEYAGWLLSLTGWGAINRGVREGETWAADNACFTATWTAERFREWLIPLEKYRPACLFVVCPDVLGDWKATREKWDEWRGELKEWPLAYVGQDWQPSDRVPWDELTCYFVGGTDAWKDSAESLALVKEARERGKRVHVGRCNTDNRLIRFLKAYRHKDELGWPEGLTFDGNGIRRRELHELSDATAVLRMEGMW